MANGTSKNVGLGKFWSDLDISEAFLMGREVSFSRVFFASRSLTESRIFLQTGLGSLGFVVFPFGFQESNFLEFKDTTYRTERVN